MIRYHDFDYREVQIDREYISAENQCWDPETLKQLWDEEGVCYDGKGIMPVKVTHRRADNQAMIALGFEDDGTVFFEKNANTNHYLHYFSAYWLDSVIAQLQEVKRRLEEEKKTI